MKHKWTLFRHLSLKRKLFLAISLLVLCCILLVTSLSYSRYAGDFSDQSTDQMQQLIEQLAINTETYLDDLFRLCLSPYYSTDVMAQLQSTPIGAQAKLEKKRVIESFLREVMTIPRNDILRVYILTDDIYYSTRTGHSLNFSGDFQEEAWYQEAISTQETVFIPVHLEQYGGYKLSIFSVVQQLRSTENTNEVLGVIRVDANYAGIEEVCDKVSVMDNSALFIVDSAYNIIYENSNLPDAVSRADVFGSAQSNLGNPVTIVQNNESYIINSQEISSTGWMIAAVNSTSELTKSLDITRNYTLLLAVICSAVGIGIAVVFVRRFIQPISQTVKLMRCVQGGNLTVRADENGADEIAYLNRSFNEMLSRIQTMIEYETRLTKQVYEAKYLQKEAQYDALYNQIRPHFLFNILNTISLLIKCRREDEAIRSIEELSVMLRGMINTDRDITLSSELKIVESYLSLQQRRYDSLSYTINIDSALHGYMLPALTIQPIVENAFIHGFDKKPGKAIIGISVQLEEGCLLIRIEDNGAGMDAEQLIALNASFSDAEETDVDPSHCGIGLLNISRRIKLKFGEQYGLRIASEPSHGTWVTVVLPGERSGQCIGH